MLKTTRIEVSSKIFDTRAAVKLERLRKEGFMDIKKLYIRDVYSLEKKFSYTQLSKIASALSNPITQETEILTNGKLPHPPPFDWALETGFLPGVTDNIAGTAKEIISDLLKVKFGPDENIYFSTLFFFLGKLTQNQIIKIADLLFNPLIQRIHFKDRKTYFKDKGIGFYIPKVKLDQKPQVNLINLEISDNDLEALGKYGILNPDKTRRGPLVLDLNSLKAIKKYFKKQGRMPTDVELESLAQTWSEHCKHTIFADPIDDIKDGLFRHFIKRATEEIRKKKGKKDFCVSVFSDNSGGIVFDDKYIISHKVETHNSPSALDPFGGAITGIVGVNRDAIGFGLGAKPVANTYGFCLADPTVNFPLYKGSNHTQPMLSSRRIMDGVIEGVNAGGNQSGIPTLSGFLFFDERFRGKPLVFAGTLGLIPRMIKGKKSHIKKAMPGDYIVMIGGRVGKDGIHGATFSSEALNQGSPISAVQIGDPITQKKLSDAIIKEARDQLLFNSITDNGAGGLSCSVAEMAKESDGCEVILDRVPLKYAGLQPWEIWVSESQERMTLAVPPQNWTKLKNLLDKRGVEATIIGKFTDSGKCKVYYKQKLIMDIDLKFLHFGLPQKHLSTKQKTFRYFDPPLPREKEFTSKLLSLLSRQNITSFEFIPTQYDHNVQAETVLPPLFGRGRVNSDVCAFRPVLSSPRTVIISYGLYPNYSDIDTYHMTTASIDTAIRNVVAAGANLDYLALLDNFCWCSSNDPIRLYQLKKALMACYDTAVAYGTPFISGKDSMFNDFIGFNKLGKQINISIPPTLLISSLGVVDDPSKLVTADLKKAGDLIFLLGDTHDELGASEYFTMLGDKYSPRRIGNSVPIVNSVINKKLYMAVNRCINRNIVSSSISVGRGGLGIALAKKAIAGKLGLSIELNKLKGSFTRDDFALFSESQGRIIVSVAPKNLRIFENILKDISYSLLGKVNFENKFTVINKDGQYIINTNVSSLDKYYHATFKDY